MTMQWIVMTASAPAAHTPTGRHTGEYRRVALVKLTLDYAEKGLRPKLISVKEHGVLEVRDLGSFRLGRSPRTSAYAKAVQYAEHQVERLNKEG